MPGILIGVLEHIEIRITQDVHNTEGVKHETDYQLRATIKSREFN